MPPSIDRFARRTIANSICLDEDVGPLPQFVQAMTVKLTELRDQGCVTFRVGFESLGEYAEEGSSLYLYGERPETDEEIHERQAEYKKNSARALKAWETRRSKQLRRANR